jgi:quercetin dioxygenase-like cupin family protein
VGMISQIEREVANPSIKTLEHLRAALGVTLSEIISNRVENKIRSINNNNIICRIEDRVNINVSTNDINKQILSPDGEHDFQFMIITLPPGVRSSDVLIGAGEKAGLVMAGTLVLSVKDEAHHLNAGDSFQFSSLDIHYIENQTDENAVVLWIMNTKLLPSTI